MATLRHPALGLVLAAGVAGCASRQGTAPAPSTPPPAPMKAKTALDEPADPMRSPMSRPFLVSTGAWFGGLVKGEVHDVLAANASFDIHSRILTHAGEPVPPDAPGNGESGNVTQISFAPEGADFDPDIAHDGKTIVFASTQHRETADLYIKAVESRVVTQITSDPANDLMPRFSPDGSRIAFASDRAGNWDIYVMPATGGKPIQVTASPAPELHPSWSPDGTELVFCRLGETSGQWEMWITSVSNPGVARFIGNGLFPEWCPVAGTGASGADRIAFQKSRERGDRAFGIWVMDYKAGEAGNSTELASTPTAACINPAWSQGGEWIAYATVPNPALWAGDSRPAWAELWMVDAAGNNRVALTGGKFVNLMPAWGPQNRLFFVSDRAGVDNIWMLDTAKVIALAATNSRNTPAMGTVSRRTSPAGAPLIVNVPENEPNPPR